jgi:hypothetical protein
MSRDKMKISIIARLKFKTGNKNQTEKLFLMVSQGCREQKRFLDNKLSFNIKGISEVGWR